MQKAIIGKKIGMTQIFDENGRVIPVTVVEAGPCVIVQKKTVENDGYAAVQMGYGDVKPQRLNKPEKGNFAKADVAPKKTLKEFRLDNSDALNVGDVVKADTFAVGDSVDVSGTSKGKGFAGTIKRHGFHRGPMGHGSKSHREPGSLGPMTSGGGGKVVKGKKLPGQMGGNQATVLHLSIVKVDMDKNLILVKGGIPGAKGSLVMIRDTVKPR